MKEIIHQRLQVIAGTISAQYTASGNPPATGIAGDEFYRIKSRAMDQNREIVTDGMFICAAAYYNEPSWVNIIL